jgi:hypothetical protein
MEVEMQKFALLAAAAALIGALTASGAYLGGGALAQGAAKPRSAASMECSQQADAKGLHGKARKHFRSKCIRDMAKAGKDNPHKGLGYH